LTGGQVSETVNTFTDKDNVSDKEQSREIDWKSILVSNYSKSHEILSSERAWSKFCINLRDLCPETQWISISQIENPIEQDLLNECESLIKRLVASSQWPFPERIVLAFNNKTNFKLKVSLITNKEITFDFFSKKLTLTPAPSPYTCSWEIEKRDLKVKLSQGEV